MPYKSLAQEGLFHSANSPVGPEKVAEFDSATKGMHLPKHVKHMKDGGVVSKNTGPNQKVSKDWGVDLTKWANESEADKLDDATRNEGNLDAKAQLEKQRQAAVDAGSQQPVQKMAGGGIAGAIGGAMQPAVGGAMQPAIGGAMQQPGAVGGTMQPAIIGGRMQPGAVGGTMQPAIGGAMQQGNTAGAVQNLQQGNTAGQRMQQGNTAGAVQNRWQQQNASGAVGHFAKGGKVPGKGSGDHVAALLEPGELVIPKKDVEKMFTPKRTWDHDEDGE